MMMKIMEKIMTGDKTTVTDTCDLICNYRTQAVTGRDDPYCVQCWDEELNTEHEAGPSVAGLTRRYWDRDDCMDENLKTVEECCELWEE